MSKFKIGDRVKIVKAPSSTRWFQYVGKSDKILSIDSVGNYELSFEDHSWWCEDELELIPTLKTWETLEVGDIIIHPDGDEAKVLAVLGEVFLRSCWGEFEFTSDWRTKKQTEKLGWTIKQDEPSLIGTERTVTIDGKECVVVIKEIK